MPNWSRYDPRYLLLGAYGADATWCTSSEWWKSEVHFDDEPIWDWRVALDVFPTATVAVVGQPLYSYRRHARQTTAPQNVSSTFEVIASRWERLAEGYFLPKLSSEDASVMSMPWLRDPQKSSPEMLESWSRALLDSVSDSSVRHDLAMILKRRFALAATSPSLKNCKRASFIRLAGVEMGALLRDASLGYLRN